MNIYTNDQTHRGFHSPEAVTEHVSKIFNGRTIVRVEGHYEPLDGDDIVLVFVLDNDTRVEVAAYASGGIGTIDIDTRKR